MIRATRRHLLAASIVVGLVAGSIAIGGTASAGGPPQPPGLDHYKCYQADPVVTDVFERRPKKVVLRDQFGQEEVRVAKFPNRLCTPVNKIHGDVQFPPTNPEAHLVCWKISSTVPSPTFNVRVLNQFGDANLTVTDRQRLCLPSWKRFPGQTFPPDTAPPGRDHFKCYKATYAGPPLTNRFEGKPPTVILIDQFGERLDKVLQPKELCNPVEKTRPDGEVTPITNPSAHLVCFGIDEDPEFNGPVVQVKNQFGQGTLDVQSEDRLCLPSFKQIINPPGA
jgi:hypothetical protein